MIYTKLPIVFLSLLASEKNGSTNSIIASYILNNLDDMKDMGIVQFARKCNVSIASISRFCREIGLDSFAELKMILNQSNLKKGPGANDGIFYERISDYASEIANGINQVTLSISESDILELVEDLVNYKKVASFGLMKAATAALILQSDLLMYEKQITTYIAFKEQMDYILKAAADELIILFSFTGSYFDYFTLKPFLKKKKHPKIWMITGSNSIVPDFVHKCIRFSSNHNHFWHPSQLNFLATIIAQEYNHYICNNK